MVQVPRLVELDDIVVLEVEIESLERGRHQIKRDAGSEVVQPLAGEQHVLELGREVPVVGIAGINDVDVVFLIDVLRAVVYGVVDDVAGQLAGVEHRAVLGRLEQDVEIAAAVIGVAQGIGDIWLGLGGGLRRGVSSALRGRGRGSRGRTGVPSAGGERRRRYRDEKQYRDDPAGLFHFDPP